LDEEDARKTGKPAVAGYRLRLGMALAANGDKDSGRKEIASALKTGGDTLNKKEISDARTVLQGS
ncbi:MAG: hypothetical protein KDB79_00100, partial [Acidobacteria bacterium]|nr:hypothetical protein [Acidobacteriota bacterium]